LALQGWDHKRWVVVLRRPLTREKVAQAESDQLMLSFIEAKRNTGVPLPTRRHSTSIAAT